MSANVDVWRGLGAGFVFRYYSGYPINETIGSDSISFPGTNGDGDANDRPVQGSQRRDATDSVARRQQWPRDPQRHSG